MKARQIPLDLPHRTATGRQDFLVADCNRAAVALVDAWPDWPAPLTAIVGPAGSGKSHLAAVWAEETKAERLDLADPRPQGWEERVKSGGTYLLEDIDRVVSPDLEVSCFHLINTIADRQARLLLTARDPLARVTIGLPDLASRLRAAQSVEIAAPDDTLLGAVLLKQFTDRQIAVAPDVLNFVLARIERSFESVRRTVSVLDAAGLSSKRALTTPFARDVLFSNDQPPLDESWI